MCQIMYKVNNMLPENVQKMFQICASKHVDWKDLCVYKKRAHTNVKQRCTGISIKGVDLLNNLLFLVINTK